MTGHGVDPLDQVDGVDGVDGLDGVHRVERVGARRTGTCVALLLAVVALLVAAGAGPASAHAVLVAANPADGSSTATAPAHVTLRFDEVVRAPSVVVVTGPDGARADRGNTRVVDDRVDVALAVAGPGRYTVAYRVVSADGHPVAGTTHFRYQGPSLNPAPRPAASDSARARVGAGSGLGAGWVVAGVVLVLVAALAVVLVRRRPGPGSTGPAGAEEDTGGRTGESPPGDRSADPTDDRGQGRHP